jgi:hypothetical protein
MKDTFSRLLFLMALLVLVTSCGRTVYRAKVYKSPKFINQKARYHFWHAHGAKPRQHRGGYW